MSEDYEVVTANSGTRALHYFDSDKADLMLLDIRMDGKDGIETLKELRQMDNGKDVPVIMLTSTRKRAGEFLK